jgi:two-component system, NarL family, sensor histidine kinase DesK
MPRLTTGTGWLSTSPVPTVDTDSTASGSDEQTRVPAARNIPGGPRLARAVMLAVLCSYVAVQVIDVVTAPLPSHGFKLGLDIAALVGVFALTVSATCTEAERWPQWRRLATLVAQAILTYFPLVVLGTYWADMAGFFAGSALLLLSGWMAWTVFAAVIAGMIPVAAATAADLGAYGAAYLTLSTLVLGLVVFGLARLSAAIRYVHATRGELAQLAVIRERMRFARDLHDLLGYSLSAITLKTEVTRRLVGSNPARARDELGEVLDISRQALADVRTVASGYRNISLAKEASSVASLLTSAGISTRVEVTCGALDEQVDTVLATVLREAVTNMLRHATPRNCVIEAEITDDTIRVVASNDGTPRSALFGRHGGGLDNLRTRLEAIGGSLSVNVRGDGWYTVLAEAPLEPAEPAAALGAASGPDHRPDKPG